jgi:DNA/RNA-binding domain of Phe-tRNA-synthetase-like protein
VTARRYHSRRRTEALTRRAEQGLPRINALTDICNAISALHRIPPGGEDFDRSSSSMLSPRSPTRTWLLPVAR